MRKLFVQPFIIGSAGTAQKRRSQRRRLSTQGDARWSPPARICGQAGKPPTTAICRFIRREFVSMHNPHTAAIRGIGISKLQHEPSGCISRIGRWRICRFCLSEARYLIPIMKAARICTVMKSVRILLITERRAIHGGTTVPTQSTGMRERTRLRMSISFIPAALRSPHG